MKNILIDFIKEEATRAKKEGLTKRQFITCEIIKAFLIIGACDLLFNFYILFYAVIEILKNI